MDSIEEYDIKVTRARKVRRLDAALQEVGLPPDRISAFGNIFYERALSGAEWLLVYKAHEVCGIPMGAIETGILFHENYKK